MLDGLVAVGVLPHAGQFHLLHLVDHAAVGARTDDVRHGEYRVDLGGERLVAAVEVDEPLHVVEYRPVVVPGVAFAVGAAPLVGVEGCEPAAVLEAAAHEARFLVEDVAVVIHHA